VAVAEGAVLASSDGICVTLTAQGDAGNRLYLDLAVCGAVWRDDAVETADDVGAFVGHSGPGRADGAGLPQLAATAIAIVIGFGLRALAIRFDIILPVFRPRPGRMPGHRAR
jgi:hypothetical protein